VNYLCIIAPFFGSSNQSFNNVQSLPQSFSSQALEGSSFGQYAPNASSFNNHKSTPKLNSNTSTNNIQISQGRYHGPNVCRMCGIQFSSPNELKLHIKSEGHFDSALAMPQNNGITSHPDLTTAFNSQIPRQFNPSETKSLHEYSKFGVSSNLSVDGGAKLKSMLSQVSSESPTILTNTRNKSPTTFSDGNELTGIAVNTTSLGKVPHIDDTVADRERNLREILRNKLKGAKVDTTDKVPALSTPVVTITKRNSFAKNKLSVIPGTRTNDNDALDFDRGRRADVSVTHTILFHEYYKQLND